MSGQSVRKTGKSCLLGIYLLAVPLLLKSQEKGWEALEQLHRKYAATEGMSFQAHLKMTATAPPRQQLDKLEGAWTKYQQQYYAHIGPVKMIGNGKYVVTIDHSDKEITIYPAGESGAQSTSPILPDISAFIKAIRKYGVAVALHIRGDEYWLDMTNLPDPAMQECHIQYDPRQWLIRRIWIKSEQRVNDATKQVIVDINYDHYLLGKPADNKLSADKYLLMNNKQVSLQPAYKNYTLINQL